MKDTSLIRKQQQPETFSKSTHLFFNFFVSLAVATSSTCSFFVSISEFFTSLLVDIDRTKWFSARRKFRTTPFVNDADLAIVENIFLEHKIFVFFKLISIERNDDKMIKLNRTHFGLRFIYKKKNKNDERMESDRSTIPCSF